LRLAMGSGLGAEALGGAARIAAKWGGKELTTTHSLSELPRR